METACAVDARHVASLPMGEPGAKSTEPHIRVRTRAPRLGWLGIPPGGLAGDPEYEEGRALYDRWNAPKKGRAPAASDAAGPPSDEA